MRCPFFCAYHVPAFNFKVSLYLGLLTLLCLSQAAADTIEDGSAATAQELLSNEPSSFVNHSVNAITGNYHEHVVYFEVAGPHPLTYQETFISGIGWRKNHQGSVQGIETPSPYDYYDYYDADSDYYDHDDRGHDECSSPPEPSPPWRKSLSHSLKSSTSKLPKKKEKYGNKIPLGKYLVGGDYGVEVLYEGDFDRNHPRRVLRIKSESLKNYVTNSPDNGGAAGKHIKNNKLEFSKENKELLLTTGDGHTRHYEFDRHFPTLVQELISEDLPNGCSVWYSDGLVESIQLKNKKGEVLSGVSRSYPDPLYRSTDGKSMHYGGSKHRGVVTGSDFPQRIYDYAQDDPEHPKILYRFLPDNRYLATRYYQKAHNQNGDTAVRLPPRDPRVGRVMHQMAPVGTDQQPIITHRYFYNLRTEKDGPGAIRALGGQTMVFDAHQNRTDYNFNDDYRLTSISKWGEGNQSIYSTEQFFWGDNNTPNGTNLMTRALVDGNGKVKVCRTYTYDENGNATQKCLWGNLTGKSPGNIFLKAKGEIGPGRSNCECAVKSYQYSLGRPNLLVSETDGRKSIKYSYQPDTNLNTSRLVMVGDKIYKRELNTYDENGCLTSTLIDDGTTVVKNCRATERRLTTIKNRKEAPIGLPQVIEQHCVDFSTNKNIFLGKNSECAFA